MDQSLNRVVARGVRPHFSCRNMTKIVDDLRMKKLNDLCDLDCDISFLKKSLKRFSFMKRGSKEYYYIKDSFNKKKARVKQIRSQEWFLKLSDEVKNKRRNGAVLLSKSWRY